MRDAGLFGASEFQRYVNMSNDSHNHWLAKQLAAAITVNPSADAQQDLVTGTLPCLGQQIAESGRSLHAEPCMPSHVSPQDRVMKHDTITCESQAT